MGLDFAGINPVKALYWTAVINGLLAPFLLVAILVVASDKKLMQGQPSSRLGWTVVAITTVVPGDRINASAIGSECAT